MSRLLVQTVPFSVVAVFAGISLVLLAIAVREVWIAFRYRTRRPTARRSNVLP